MPRYTNERAYLIDENEKPTVQVANPPDPNDNDVRTQAVYLMQADPESLAQRHLDALTIHEVWQALLNLQKHINKRYLDKLYCDRTMSVIEAIGARIEELRAAGLATTEAGRIIRHTSAKIGAAWDGMERHRPAREFSALRELFQVDEDERGN